MKKQVSLFVAALALAGFAKAEMKAAASPLPVQGGIEWTGYGVGKSHSGDVKLKSGKVDMKGKDIVGGEFVFDMKTLATPDSEKLQGHLRSPDFFDVEKFTEAKFVIKSAKTLAKPAADGATHEITGDLTIKGKTNAITFPAQVTENGKMVVAKGAVTIADRTSFDIKYNSAKFFDIKKLGDKLIEDKIDIKLNLTAQR